MSTVILRWLRLLAVFLASLAAVLIHPRALPAQSNLEIPATDEGLPGVGPIRRYDWFRDLWKTRRSDWVKQRDAQQGAVVFLGDSITQGFGDDFRKAFPGLKLANRGISGDTTRGMLVRLKDDVLVLKPKAVVILAEIGRAHV